MNIEDIIYCDYNATAPLRPEAREAMLAWLGRVGNASSAHTLGQRAAEAVTLARHQIAALFGARADEIIFTSGATEANNLALNAALRNHPSASLIHSSVEHPAVLEIARHHDREGRNVRAVRANADGTLDLDDLASALTSSSGGAVISVMAANNETGVLHDMNSIMRIARGHGDVVVHTDATQLVGRAPIDAAELDVDLLSLSAHKFGGPQGVGSLFIRRGLALPVTPLSHGGQQERGWRSGTINVAGVVAAGAAAAATLANLNAERARVTAVRDEFEAALLADTPTARIIGNIDERLPGVSSVMLRGVPAQAVLAAMPDVAASDGSACASGALEVSHVLTAMGLSTDDAESVIRFSFGYASTLQEARAAAARTSQAAMRVHAAMNPDMTPRPDVLQRHGVCT